MKLRNNKLKRKFYSKFLFALAVIIGSSFQIPLFAQETLTVGRSYRSLAMGNTGVASANDSAALYYNPAILANVTGWWLDYTAYTVETSDNFTPLEAASMLAYPVFPYINRDGITDLSKSTFLSKENPYLRANAGINLSVNISERGWTIAGSQMYESVMTTIDDGATIYQRDDLIQKVGLSIPIGMGQLVLGITGNRIIRRVASDATTDSIPNWGDRYTGTGYDIGLLFRMANQARITLGFVVQNYGGIKLGDSGMVEEQTMAFGMSTNHEFGIFKLTLAADIREIGSEAAKTNTLHAGAELGIFPNSTGGSYLTYRTGFNQGYFTQGVEINLFNHYLIVGYTQYSEEVGTDTEKVESKRSIVYLSLGF